MEDNVIYEYSTRAAVDDGLFTDCSAFLNPSEYGVSADIVFSAGVMDLIERAVNHPDQCNDTVGVIWDILTMFRHAIRSGKEEPGKGRITFEVIITGTGRKKYHTVMAVIGPWSSSDARPVITMFLPSED